MRAITITGLTVAITLVSMGDSRAGEILPPTLVYQSDLPVEPGRLAPVGSGVTFKLTIVDAAGDYAAYHDDLERIALAAGAAWAKYFDGNASIELRLTFDEGDGTYIMAAGPVLVQTPQMFGATQVWQAGTIWEISGKGDPNGTNPDGDILVAPSWLSQIFWGYPDPPPAGQIDAFDVLQHELGHVLGFLHVEDYYTGDKTWATSYDIQTQPSGTGHVQAGDITVRGYGEPVPLADTIFDADRSHVGLESGVGSLMYPFAFPGVRHTLSKVELGILADAGMPVDLPCLDNGTDLALDTDDDNVADCVDNCPETANADQADGDDDGVGDVCDACPDDATKTDDPGVCGCGTPDEDTDTDGVADCIDDCPDDSAKSEPGECGCGELDGDTDGDGTPDCLDGCPEDAAKLDAGTCGCGEVDTDTDDDGTPDCVDGCPEDPDKTEPGADGCGPIAPPEDTSFLTLDGGADSTSGGIGCGAGVVVFLPWMVIGLLFSGSRRRRRW